jgi:hypothetical protein
METIKANQLAYKKQVGKTKKGTPVWELATKGGLHLIVKAQDGNFETLGTGPHRAIARHIADQHEPEIAWTELSKSDHLDYVVIEPLLPKYEKLTAEMRLLEQKAK